LSRPIYSISTMLAFHQPLTHLTALQRAASVLSSVYYAIGAVGKQIRGLNETAKDTELEMLTYKRKSDEASTKLREMRQLFESARSDRNVYGKNLLNANVSDSDTVLLLHLPWIFVLPLYMVCLSAQ